MASTIHSFYFVLVFLYLFCISKSSKITFYENENLKGRGISLNVNQNICHNLPKTWNSRITSVNTYGSCFFGWVQQNCTGNVQELHSGKPNSLDLRNSQGPLDIKSTSLCSTKIHGSYGHPNKPTNKQQGPDLWQTVAYEHNKYRKRHNSPFLRSNDPKIHNMAQKHVDYLARSNGFDHSQNSRKSYGENIAWTTRGKTKTDAVKEAVKNWYSEEKYYNYNRPGFSSKTGHFTALVWKNTKLVGIGVAWSSQKR